ncbi:MAG: RDD family protein [Thermoplasmata archaeon]|nr:RDD family protein [Thermoplasmata archaeon]
MVDPGQLTSDVVQGAITVLLPGLLWLFLYLLAWEEPQLARRAGFGRGVFWLLLPVGLVAWALQGNLPIFAYAGDLLAVSVSGALVPVLLSVWLLTRELPRPASTIARFLALLAAVCAIDTLAVVYANPLVTYLILLMAAAAGIAGPYLLGRRGDAEERIAFGRISCLMLLTSGGIIGTYVTTASTPGGIDSAFPFFLFTPLALGVVSVLLLLLAPRFGRSTGWPLESALPIAYATTTFGTLLGADLLRQPPLYGLAHQVVFSIGGAGLLDLVYLSGLLALVAAYGMYRLLGSSGFLAAVAPDPGPTPIAGLRRAQGFNRLGRPVEGIRYSAAAARDAVSQLRHLANLHSVPPGSSPWTDLAVPPWVVADQANLDSLASDPPADPVLAHRAWMTARFLVHLATVLGRPRFGTFTRRGRAFAIDLLLLGIPGAVGWVVYALRTAPGDSNLLTSPGFFLVSSGFATYGFLYFVLGEWLWGTSLGKRLMRLEVVNRRLGRPSILAAIVRDVPKLIPLTAIGIGGALAALLVAHPYRTVGGNLGGLFGVGTFAIIGAVLLGVGLPALVSGFGMALSSESQRLGDYFAGTWVVNQKVGDSVPPGVVVAAAAPSAAT